MSTSVGSLKNSVGFTGLAVGLLLGWHAAAADVMAQDAETDTPSVTDELLLSPALEAGDAAAQPTSSLEEIENTPSFEELDSAASDLNEALSGARAKLDELRQATELAAMAAELRDELEASIQENNRLAASLAEVQSERSELETRNNEARRQIGELTEEVEGSKLEIAEQSEELQRRQDQIEQVTSARDQAEEQIRQLEVALDTSGDEVDQLRSEIAGLTGDLETTRTELGLSNDKAEEAREARDLADRELSKVKKQIAGMLRSVLLGGEPIDVSKLEEEAEANGETAALGLGVRYEAIRPSNVRAAPDPGAQRVGFAKRGDSITVLSKVDGRNWFEIETIDGVRGYIFGELIKPGA